MSNITERLRAWPTDYTSPHDDALMREAADTIESLRAELERKSEAIQKLWRERDEARAEAEALRADAERYRWLTRPGERIGDNWRTAWHKWDGSDGKAGFDAAIDSAHSAKE